MKEKREKRKINSQTKWNVKKHANRKKKTQQLKEKINVNETKIRSNYRQKCK